MSASNISMASEINNINQKKMGHALSIYVFTRRQFRLNSCARYFLALSVSGYAVVCITIPIRVLQTVYNINIFTFSNILCQLLSYLLNCFRVLPSWFIVEASLDRYLCSSSSATLRKWSTIRVASHVIPLTILFVGVFYIHMPFNYTILLPQRVCSFASNSYRSFFSIWNLIFWSWFPTICMVAFGLLTIRHAQQSRMRVATQNNARQNRRKIDRQLIRMLIMQSFVLASTTTAYSISNLYISITSNLIEKNDLEKANDSLLESITNWMTLIGPCLSFYLFISSSKLFRRELIKLFHRLQRIITTN